MLLIRSENPRRCQAENPLKLLSEFPGPALIAAFDEQQKQWDEAAAALGFGAVDDELRAALGKERDFVASVPKTKAASLPGVAAKLAMLIQLGEPSPTDTEFPWPELRSALADIARLASPEAVISPM
jgi:hypothetical protein